MCRPERAKENSQSKRATAASILVEEEVSCALWGRKKRSTANLLHPSRAFVIEPPQYQPK